MTSFLIRSAAPEPSYKKHSSKATTSSAATRILSQLTKQNKPSPGLKKHTPSKHTGALTKPMQLKFTLSFPETALTVWLLNPTLDPTCAENQISWKQNAPL